MFDSINTFLREWSKSNDDRAKLQHTYFALAIAVLLIAGLASLVNTDLGQALLMLSATLAALFFANAVTWALLQSFVLLRFNRSRSAKK
ncbi:MAG TPA: hypothetical protein VGE13_03185 [Candidatus Saccharimonadales bacterium]